MKEQIDRNFEESAAMIRRTREHLAGRIEQAVEIIRKSLQAGNAVYIFGNGGSASDAQHITGELVGRFQAERKALKAFALVGNASVLTCIGNDYGYDRVFSRQLEAMASAGDVAVGLTTSGNSPNVLLALELARKIGMKTVVFTGSGGGKCAALADVLLDVPSTHTARIQEAHAVIYHTICQLVEQFFVGKQ
jgi:D-sedoheptulose 7-phosphate isomerase